MFKLIEKVPAWAWAMAALGVAVYVVGKGGVKKAAADALEGVAGVLGDLTEGAITGTIKGGGGVVGSVAAGIGYGVGDLFGVPRTEQSRCAKAKAAGNVWDASMYCTAADFLMWSKDRAFNSLDDFLGKSSKPGAVTENFGLKDGLDQSW